MQAVEDIYILKGGVIKPSRGAERLYLPSETELRMKRRRKRVDSLWPVAFVASLFKKYPWLAGIEARLELTFETDRTGIYRPRVNGNAYIASVVEHQPLPTDYIRLKNDGLMHHEEVAEFYTQMFGQSIYALPKRWCNRYERSDFGVALDSAVVKASTLEDTFFQEDEENPQERLVVANIV